MPVDSRFERLERMLGADALSKLANTHMLVIGIGGVGSNCVVALARGGVGALTIVDYDTVDASNINRQALAFESTVGRVKTEVMREIILDINPNAKVDCINERILPDNVEEYLTQEYDYCIDAQDTITTKLALASFCETRGISYLSSMGAANKHDPTQLEFADIYETRVCPMCRAVRKQARSRNITHMPVLYTPEQPAEVSAAQGAQRSERTELGTMSYMPPIMGQMLAARAICDVLEIEWQR